VCVREWNRPPPVELGGVSERFGDGEQTRVRATNEQSVVAIAEAYEPKAAAKKGCESVVRAAAGAPIEETAS
jgi:uncharacterized protein YegP (UPF0339 family)